MRVLLLSSDWKWTGPAEPMLLLAAALRAAGHDVFVACPEAPAGARGTFDRAGARGFPVEFALQRGRGVRPLRDRADVRRLREFVAAERIEIVHVWHTRAHWLARRALGGGSKAALVRSLEHCEALARTPWNRWFFGPACDGLLCPSRASARANEPLRGGRPTAGALGCVDLQRFVPASRSAAALRAQLGVEPGAALVGVVARVQRHRRFDLLLDAFAQLASRWPQARLLILGRGTHEDEVARAPVQARGLEDRVVFAGHREGDDYVAALCSLDLLVFLVPGSDGSCRAVLEAAACGVPTVALRRGALPEIVRDGETGLLVDEHAGALALSCERLLADGEERSRLGAGALERARKQFSPAERASAVVLLYGAALEHARGAR